MFVVFSGFVLISGKVFSQNDNFIPLEKNSFSSDKIYSSDTSLSGKVSYWESEQRRNKIFTSYGMLIFPAKTSMYGAGFIHDFQGIWSIKTGAYIFTHKKYAFELTGYRHWHIEHNNWDFYFGGGVQYIKTEDQKLFYPDLSLRGDFNVTRNLFTGVELNFNAFGITVPFVLINFGYKF